MNSTSNIQPKQLKQSKPKTKRAEKVWRLIAFLVSVAVLMLGNKIYLFHTQPEFAQFKKGDPKDILLFSIPFGLIYIVLDHMSHYLFDSWVEKNYLRNDKYKEMEARMKKSYTIVKWYFGIIFYTFTSSFAYYLLKDSYFLPPFLGGNGSVFTMVENRYLEHTTEAMRIFYLIEMGKHLARFFMHVFIRSEGSYYEYVLHHSLATFLIFFSYTMNMWMVGIFVLFVHDLSDVTLALARGYREYKDRNSNMLTFFYVIATGSWILLRVGIFTYCCIYGTWVEYLKACQQLNESQMRIFQFPYFFMALMLTLLEVMHLYWTYYIIESFINTSVSTKIAQHTYD